MAQISAIKVPFTTFAEKNPVRRTFFSTEVTEVMKRTHGGAGSQLALEGQSVGEWSQGRRKQK